MNSMPFLYHPLVVHFPVALWLTSFLFDVLFAYKKEPFFATASRYLMGLGLLAAVVSIVAGFMDYVPLVREGIGQAFVDRHNVHGLLAYLTTLLYAGLLATRWRWPRMPQALSLGGAVVAAMLVSVTGYLGGEIRRVM
ncbi:MAG: DUF2231 domain-containing protein [Bacillati bacterium ANGP1]|uniref:DUF2231 domain-containing protein n=1 Tax=Candidatus Segetimicrobium genomatis TaxID=2569760 RepID=A0A537IZV9_9BACT|nr:MAG: DUF2231 domain-containing protein [Terrabacteria group bacterium ANGP1]